MNQTIPEKIEEIRNSFKMQRFVRGKMCGKWADNSILVYWKYFDNKQATMNKRNLGSLNISNLHKKTCSVNVQHCECSPNIKKMFCELEHSKSPLKKIFCVLEYRSFKMNFQGKYDAIIGRIIEIDTNLKYSTCANLSILPNFSFDGMCANCGGSHPKALHIHAIFLFEKCMWNGFIHISADTSTWKWRKRVLNRLSMNDWFSHNNIINLIP